MNSSQMEQANLYKLIFDNIESIVFLKDAQTFRFKFVNKATAEVVGLKIEEMIGRTDHDLFGPEVGNDYRMRDEEVLNKREPVITASEKIIHNNGAVSWVRTTKIPIFEGEDIIYILGISEDISYYKRYQIELEGKIKELNQQKNFLQNTINQLPGIFYAKDTQGNFLNVNEKFCELLNKKTDEIVGRNNSDLFEAKVAENFRQTDLQITQTKETMDFEEYSKGADGEDHTFQSYKFPYLNENGDVYATGGISLDITKMKNLEKRNLKNTKMAAIGEIATNISHEINNPLTVVKGLLFKIQRRLEKKDQEFAKSFLGDFEQVKNSVSRITNIVQALHTFSNKNIEEKEEFLLDQFMAELGKVANDIHSKDGVKIFVTNGLQEKDLTLHGNKTNLKQALLSLVANACDAVTLGSNPRVNLSVSEVGGDITFSVQDYGQGIKEEIKEKIFETFFTTKPVNKGTGIGLAMAQSIAKEHLGIVELSSTSERGSVFTLKIPSTYKTK